MAVKWFQTGAGCINDGGTDREKEQKTLVKLKKGISRGLRLYYANSGRKRNW